MAAFFAAMLDGTLVHLWYANKTHGNANVSNKYGQWSQIAPAVRYITGTIRCFKRFNNNNLISYAISKRSTTRTILQVDRVSSEQALKKTNLL